MIVMRQKDVDWILERLAGAEDVVVVGCGTCATVCFAGGEREVEELCCALQLAVEGRGAPLRFEGLTCKRLCDWEFIEPVADRLRQADAVLSLGCGAGSNLLADRLEEARIIPGVDTLFMGTHVAPAQWQETCAGCGNCVLDRTFGICPIARCAKSLLNGPCGGAKDGKCEVHQEVDCAWVRIVHRAKALGRLDDLLEVIPPKDWSTARDGGQRTLKRDDLGLSRIATEDLDEG